MLKRPALDRHKAHLRTLHGFADRLRISRVVLTSLAAQAVRRHELGRDDAHRVAELLKLPRPVVRARARLHADHARRQFGDQLQQRISPDRRAHQHRLAFRIHSVHHKHVLGEIDPNRNNGHGLPLPSELMRFATPSWHFDAVCRNTRLARDGEVPFIC